MFQLDKLVRNAENRLEWKYYYQNKDIDMIYRAIEISNIENEVIKNEMLSYRILIDDRVFAFLDTSEYKLNFMREHYNTNEKCKPRYESDAYDECVAKCKVKKKGRKK